MRGIVACECRRTLGSLGELWRERRARHLLGETPIGTRHRPNTLSPMGFVIAFGAVSMLADVVYEGARAIVGPYLATLGASAALVGLVTGAGEAVALVLRLLTGPLADKTRRYWTWSIAGYLMTVVAVPLLSFSATLGQASALVIAERFGKAVRTPARDTMLSHAGGRQRRGRAFALHELLDQTGALAGPLVVALMIALGSFRTAFRVLLIPGLGALALLAWLRRRVPRPQDYETDVPDTYPGGAAQQPVAAPLPRRFWRYSAFTAISMLGFATFGVISYHLEVRHVLAPDVIPIVYAAAMAAAALAALGAGFAYDRIGLASLIIVPPLTSVIPLLSFSTVPLQVWWGAVLWGTVVGLHGSTMRAAVADLAPAARRGLAYGVFSAAYGLAWLVGATLIGALYAHSLPEVQLLTGLTQALALVVFVPLLRSGKGARPAA